MTKPVLNVADAQAFDNTPEGSERFGARVAPIGRPLGLTGLGCMHVTVEPGRRAFPFHNHLGNDEMFVILEGTGEFRLGDETHPVKAGDVCAAPKGGPETAHQIVNTGTTTLRYLGISTMQDPEVVEYPDSGKFGAVAIAPGPDFMRAHLKYIGRPDSAVDYWDGEKL